MLRNNADARRCLYFELGLPVMKLSAIKEKAIFLDRRLKSVNVFAFTNKFKLVMKGNELELWIASFNNMQLYHSTELPLNVDG